MNDTDFLKLEQKIDQLRSTQDKRDAFLELSMSKPDNNSPLSLKSQIVLEDILKRFPKELFCISISDYQDFRAHVKACFMDSFEGVFLIEHDLRWDQVLMSTDGFFAAKHRTSFGGTGYDLDLIQSLVNSTSLLSQCRSLDALHIMSDFVSSGRGKKMALPRSNLFRHIVDSLISLEASGADPYFELQSLELVSQDAFVFENMRDALLERLPAMLNHRSEKTLETTLRVYPGLTHHVEADNVQSMHQFATLVYRGAELSKLKASFKKILKTASPEDLRASRNLIDLFLPFLHAEEEGASFEENKNRFTPPLFTFQKRLTNLKKNKKGIPLNCIFIDQLELTSRTYNCLKRANIHTLLDLLSKTEEDLLRIDSFRMEDRKHIWDTLEKHLPIDLLKNKLSF